MDKTFLKRLLQTLTSVTKCAMVLPAPGAIRPGDFKPEIKRSAGSSRVQLKPPTSPQKAKVEAHVRFPSPALRFWRKERTAMRPFHFSSISRRRTALSPSDQGARKIMCPKRIDAHQSNNRNALHPHQMRIRPASQANRIRIGSETDPHQAHQCVLPGAIHPGRLHSV